MIITIAGTKGGVGKTTFAANLAAVKRRSTQKILLLDADPQGSLYKWALVREHIADTRGTVQRIECEAVSEHDVYEVAVQGSQKGYTVIIDTPGVLDSSVRAALVRSDFIVIPTGVAPVEMWEVQKLIDEIKKLELVQGRIIPKKVFFTRVPPRGKRFIEAAGFLEEKGISCVASNYLTKRAAFSYSFGTGIGVNEYRPFDSMAYLEMMNCTTEIDETLSDLKKRK